MVTNIAAISYRNIETTPITSARNLRQPFVSLSAATVSSPAPRGAALMAAAVIGMTAGWVIVERYSLRCTRII